MNAASNLILTDKAGEEKADDMLAALSELAYASNTPSYPEPAPKKKRHRSRFFFVLSESIVKDVERARAKIKPKKLDHVDDEVNSRLKKLRQTMPKDLEKRIKDVREFFLDEIGPRSLAGNAGSIQARDVVQRLLNTEIDGTQFAKFERMSHEAVNIKMAKFIARYYGLPQKDAASLLQSIAPKQQQPFMIPVPTGDSNAHRTTKRHKEEGSDTRAISAPDL